MSASELRSTLEAACAAERCSMKELTVLASHRDPFRLDTPARHRDGEWLAVRADELGLGDRRIHLRGLHYMLATPGSIVKPDGHQYTNTDDDWEWLLDKASKAARWLGYLPFDQVIDARNAAPVTCIGAPSGPSRHYIAVGAYALLPDVRDLGPRVGVEGFTEVQPNRLVLFGEKTSLEDVLGSIADEHAADLYLPKGEISDTMLHQMASEGAADERPMVVLCFSDCDPAGWQMPISIGRKLQAFRSAMFPDLSFRVYRVALTPDHVREYGLPSTPLKPAELRADRWRTAMGVAQTEIDALAALQPKLLEQIARDAIVPFFDTSLARRVREAEQDWLAEAQERLERQIDQEQLQRIRADAEVRLAEMREDLDGIDDALRAETDAHFDPPPIDVPQADVARVNDLPLIDSGWSFAEQSRRLIADRAYESGGAT